MAFNIEQLSKIVSKLVGSDVTFTAMNDVAEYRMHFKNYDIWHSKMVENGVDQAWEKTWER